MAGSFVGDILYGFADAAKLDATNKMEAEKKAKELATAEAIQRQRESRKEKFLRELEGVKHGYRVDEIAAGKDPKVLTGPQGELSILDVGEAGPTAVPVQTPEGGQAIGTTGKRFKAGDDEDTAMMQNAQALSKALGVSVGDAYKLLLGSKTQGSWKYMDVPDPEDRFGERKTKIRVRTDPVSGEDQTQKYENGKWVDVNAAGPDLAPPPDILPGAGGSTIPPPPLRGQAGKTYKGLYTSPQSPPLGP
jgi:hypothetical protein